MGNKIALDNKLSIVILLIFNVILLIQIYNLKNALSINQEYLMLRNAVIKHDKVKLPDIDLFTLNNSKANLDSIIKCKKYLIKCA